MYLDEGTNFSSIFSKWLTILLIDSNINLMFFDLKNDLIPLFISILLNGKSSFKEIREMIAP